MNLQLRNLILFAFVLVGSTTSAITTRGGLIATEVASGGFCSITSQLLVDEIPTSYDSAFVDWGDGNVEAVTLIGWPLSPSNGSHLITLSGIWHIFSNGTFNIQLSCGKRVSWIRNTLNSGSSDFALQAKIVVNPPVWYSYSSVSDSLNLEAEMIAGSSNVIPLSIYEGDNDSVVWSLGVPLGVTGYSLPDQSGGGMFSLSQVLGQYEWNPVTTGLYSVVFIFSDYRELSPGNSFLISSATREVLIDVGNVSSVTVYVPDTDVNVYPTPSSSYTTFHFSEKPASRDIVITDRLGREIWRKESEASTVEFSVAEFPDGMYFYTITVSEARSISGKFIIEH